jgi:hypothetical protein
VLAATTAEPVVAILSAMSRLVDRGDLHSLGREDLAPVRIDTVGQAAAGGLLLSIAIVELVLGFWAAGWHHRAVGLSMAGMGLAFLASGMLEIASTRSRRGVPDHAGGAAPASRERESLSSSG